MTDIIIYPLSFGGKAFEPQTEAGRSWTQAKLESNPDLFTPDDGCMNGFFQGSIGVEPQDFDDYFDDIEAAGLTSNVTKGEA
jgi:hypothetical protein